MNISTLKLYFVTHQKDESLAPSKIPFIINDNVGLALSLDADGVHLGQSDKSCHWFEGQRIKTKNTYGTG